MKDSEFKELLNLYLDHEISADDAARLEAEVQGNPARRRLYRDYCRMQKACKVLAQDFGVDSTVPTNPKVIAFPAGTSASRRTGWYVGATFAAAAACVTLVFVSHRQQAPNSSPSPVAVHQSVSTDRIANNADAAPARRGIERGKAGDLSLRRTDANLALATAAQNDPHFAWMQDVQLTPLQSQDQQALNLNVAPSPKLNNRATVAGNRTLPSDVQWTAVRFQR